MQEINELFMNEVTKNSEYWKEYLTNPLFHEIIDGIRESDNPMESIVNTLYSYNQMLTNITAVVAQNADDESVNKIINNLTGQLEDDAK